MTICCYGGCNHIGYYKVTYSDRKDTAELKRVLQGSIGPVGYEVSDGDLKDPIGYYKVTCSDHKDTAEPKRVLLGSGVSDGSIRVPMDTYGGLVHPP